MAQAIVGRNPSQTKASVMAVHPDGSLAVRPPYVKPFAAKVAVTVPAGGNATATVNVTTDKRVYVKHVNITKGANTTIDSAGVLIDNNPTRQTASFDAEAVFGFLLTAETSVAVTGANGGTTDETLELEVLGVEVDR